MTAHLAKHATLQPLELTTWCGKTGRELPAGDVVVFEIGRADCPGCGEAQRTPECVGTRHVAPPGAAKRCACGERELDRGPEEKPIDTSRGRIVWPPSVRRPEALTDAPVEPGARREP